MSRASEQEESDFLDPLREQLGYLGSAKEVHRGRGRTLDALQVLVMSHAGWTREGKLGLPTTHGLSVLV